MLLVSHNRARQLFRNGTSAIRLSRGPARFGPIERVVSFRINVRENPESSRYSPSALLQPGWFRSCERTIRSPPTNDGIVFRESVGFVRAREPAAAAAAVAAAASLPLAFATLPYLSLSWSIERTSASREEPGDQRQRSGDRE